MNARSLSVLSLSVLLGALVACGQEPTTVFTPPDPDLGADGSQGDASLEDLASQEDMGSPDQADPDLVVEDMLVPDLGDPDQGEPDLVDMDSPDQGEPDQGEPDLSEPDLDDLGDMEEPDLGDPDLGEPDLGEPDLPDPDLGEPDLGEPDLVDMEDMGEPDLPQYDCESFALPQARFWTLPLRSVRVEAQGGSGQYTWRLAEGENRSGGSINAGTGILLAGQGEGVVDVVQVEDVGCGRTLEARVDVVVPATVTPQRLEVPVSSQLCFQIEGGSGPQGDPVFAFSWSLLQAGSGRNAVVTPEGCYAAGGEEGVDVLQIEDRRTGQLLQAAVSVSLGARNIEPQTPVVLLAAGDGYLLTAQGASGSYRFRLRDEGGTGSSLELRPEGAWIEAGEQPGQATVLIEDVFLEGMQAEVSLVVMREARHEPQPAGAHGDDQEVLGLGDVNGDGYGDVMVATRTAGFNGNSSGAAFLFLGGEGGLGQEPAQIILGERRGNQLGRSLAAGDFNDDGCQDVAVGVYAQNAGETENGEVQVYLGCSQEELQAWPHLDWNNRGLDNLPGFNAEAPLRLAWRIPGINAQDRMGYSVQAGDFNGDGLDDLAAGAYQAEAAAVRDPNTGDPVNNLGRVILFYQRQDNTLSTLPSVILEGVLIDAEGAYYGSANHRLGSGRIAAGRVNDDSCDDLLVGAWLADGNRGAVGLYLSHMEAEGCAPSPMPALTIEPTAAERGRTGWLGHKVELEDFNGDCRPDLVVTQPFARDNNSNNTNDFGNVMVFLNQPGWSVDAPLAMLRDQADVTLQADRGDQFGFGLGVGDLDHDGIQDLLVGARRAESEGTVFDVGEVYWYRGLISAEGCQGADEGAPLFAEPVLISGRPDGNQDYFGQDVEVVPDLNGDDTADLVVLAERGPSGRTEDPMDHQGALYWAPGGAQAYDFQALQQVNLPLPLYDDRWGERVISLGDWNEDGFEDFAVSATLWDLDISRTGYTEPANNAGAVFLFLGGAQGPGAQPDAVIAGFNGHYAGHQVGYSMTREGDWDGDGVKDLVIGAPFADNNGPCTSCRDGAPYRGDTGAAYVFLGGQHPVQRRQPGQPLPRLGEPDQVICGLQVSNQRVTRELASGFDINHDGRDDLVMSNWNLNNARGVVLYALSPEDRGAPVCLGDAQVLGEGDNNSDTLGFGVMGADLDGDGCAELLAGAFNDDGEVGSNHGAVHIWRGWGGPGCPSRTAHLILYGTQSGDNIGQRMVSMGDLDGQGVVDIAVGSTGYGGTNVGAVLVLRGEVLRDVIATMQDGESAHLPQNAPLAILVTPQELGGTSFARSLSASDLNGDGLLDLVVGERFSSLGDVLRRGAVHIYLGSPDALELARPDALILGPSGFPDSDFGYDAVAARQGDQGWISVLVGSPTHEWSGPEYGEMGSLFQGLLQMEVAP